MRIIPWARALLAIASLGLAAVTVTGGDYALLGQSMPVWLPQRHVLIHVCALLAVAGAAGLCANRTAAVAALVLGGYDALWALSGVPAALANPASLGVWYGVAEGTTCVAGAWTLYALLRVSRAVPLPRAIVRAVRAAQVVFGLTCLFYGASHFAYLDYTASMVPTWMPHRRAFAALTGIAHMAAGAGIVFGGYGRTAATLEAMMMSLFGLIVWVPSFFAHPRPSWAMPAEAQWSELVVNYLLASAAWIMAASFGEGAMRSGGASMLSTVDHDRIHVRGLRH